MKPRPHIKLIVVTIFCMVSLHVQAGSAHASTATFSGRPTTPIPTISSGSDGVLGDRTANIAVNVSGSRSAPGPGRSTGDVSSRESEAVGPPDPCFYEPEGAAEAVAAGDDPAKGVLYLAHCPVSSMRAGLPDGQRWVTHDVWTVNGAAPVAPPPDPAVLAASAVAQLTVPVPVVHVGAVGEPVAVKVPVSLWVDDPAALVASVSAGGVTVTATARLTSTVWSMGEPVGDPDSAGGGGRAVSLTCAGAGTPASGVAGGSSCGYTFVWRSTAARTGGVGGWLVGVVARWTVSWWPAVVRRARSRCRRRRRRGWWWASGVSRSSTRQRTTIQRTDPPRDGG